MYVFNKEIVRNIYCPVADPTRKYIRPHLATNHFVFSSIDNWPINSQHKTLKFSFIHSSSCRTIPFPNYKNHTSFSLPFVIQVTSKWKYSFIFGMSGQLGSCNCVKPHIFLYLLRTWDFYLKTIAVSEIEKENQARVPAGLLLNNSGLFHSCSLPLGYSEGGKRCRKGMLWIDCLANYECVHFFPKWTNSRELFPTDIHDYFIKQNAILSKT